MSLEVPITLVGLTALSELVKIKRFNTAALGRFDQVLQPKNICLDRFIRGRFRKSPRA